MATTADVRVRCVVLVGNPNTGKSTLFNALSGLSQHVGNYPGVTVEKKTGSFCVGQRDFLLVDLPGAYSLSPRSPDECVAFDVLLGRQPGVPRPDVILGVIDASNLERNLYLVSQLLALKTPVVLALNMNDVADRRGMAIDAERLSRNLGVPVVRINARRKQGIEELKRVLVETQDARQARGEHPHAALEQAIRERRSKHASTGDVSTFLWERLVLDESEILRASLLGAVPDTVLTEVDAIRTGLGPGESVGLVDSRARYEWIASQLRGVIRESENRDTLTDRVDRVLLHGLWGQLIAALTLLVLFQAVFTVADPASAAIDALTGVLSDAVQAFLPAGALQSLLTDGLIQGVGGVLVFLPQIFLLFFFIALLEDTGYLARVACLMDRVMSRVGLSGKSFIPLLSSFACAIPGIMAARVIEDRRDRLVTVLIAPLMCCSARLPVYTLLIAAFIPDRRYLGGVLGTQGLTMLALYLLGMLVAIGVAFLLKRFVLPGETPSFLLELPAYKRPSLGVVLRKMWNGGWAFVQGAGTLIVAVTVLVWAAAYFPAREQPVDAGLLARRDDLLQRLANGDVRSEEVHLELSRVEGQIRGLQMRRSYLGVVGRFIEPVVRPLGWDWRIGCGVIASFPAREVVVATMGVLYNLGDEQSEHSQSLRQTLRESTWEGSDRPVFNIPVALSVMVFFALCAQCASTLAVMRRETNSWRWPAFAFSYMTVLAYFAALITYQVGMLMSS